MCRSSVRSNVRRISASYVTDPVSPATKSYAAELSSNQMKRQELLASLPIERRSSGRNKNKSVNYAAATGHLSLFPQDHNFQFAFSEIKGAEAEAIISFATPVRKNSQQHQANQTDSTVKKQLQFPQTKEGKDLNELDHSPASADELFMFREDCALRAIEHLRYTLLNVNSKDFFNYAGDLMFLLRNAIFKGVGRVSAAADRTLRVMLERWEVCRIKGEFGRDVESVSRLNDLDSDSTIGHFLVYVECFHAQLEMQYCPQAEIYKRLNQIIISASQHSVDEILRFNPATRTKLPLSSARYCMKCGQFGATATELICSKPLCVKQQNSQAMVHVVDYADLTEALVWTSIFRDMAIEPLTTMNSQVKLEDCFKFIPQIRPYKSLNELVHDNYLTQCYYLTHLIFILSGWGAVKLQPIQLFIEELLFLLNNMQVAIKLKNAELVGEFLEALRILGVPEQHCTMQRGYCYLLSHEKSDKLMRGNWCSASSNFYDRYHTAYCGLIGIAPFQFTAGRDINQHFPSKFHHFFATKPYLL
jgi:hypothetical protein